MSVPDAVVGGALVDAGIEEAVRSMRPLGGGCMHPVHEVTLEGGARVVLKSGPASAVDVFTEETASLRRLEATGTVPVPRPLGCGVYEGVAVLVITPIEVAAATEAGWRRFGEDLARLHEVEAGTRYGFEMDNHLGATPQPNGWEQDWVTFNTRHRLGHQLATARARLHADEAGRIERVIERLDRFLPRRPKPALLHGDLWSGNALPMTGDRVAVIDPACSIGDGWADIAMMQLFGGFPPACFAAYRAAVGHPEGVDERLAVYQLYHLLNHVNLFGRGYVGQAMGLARRLLGRA